MCGIPRMLPVRRPSRLAHELADLLAQQIRSGVFPPNSKLPSEPQLQSTHQLSRAVVREALSQLQAKNLVLTKHGIGTFVSPTPAAPSLPEYDLSSLIEARLLLESEAASLAALRRTPAQLARLTELHHQMTTPESNPPSPQLDQQFHLLISEATANPYLRQILSSLSDQLIPRIHLQTQLTQTGLSQTFLQHRNTEHAQILQAISRQDPAGASAAMRIHLGNSRDRLLQLLD
jgi:GntR family transcriptional repressor for pyruvate dehydrogenase complex